MDHFDNLLDDLKKSMMDEKNFISDKTHLNIKDKNMFYHSPISDELCTPSSKSSDNSDILSYKNKI